MTLSSHDERLSWTQLGVHMGYTAEEPQREEILDAIERMTWTETPARPPYLDGPPSAPSSTPSSTTTATSSTWSASPSSTAGGS